MRTSLIRSFVIITVFILLGACQKEVSVDSSESGGGNGTGNSSGWSFSGPSNSTYGGCIDTAYYENVSGFNTLLLEGTDSANNYFMINLVTQGQLKPGTYTNTQGALMSVTTNTGTFISMPPGSFSITINTANDTLVTGSFSGTLTDPLSGASFTISKGNVTAFIGRPNPCGAASTGGSGGGSNNGPAAVFSLENSIGNCANAKIEGDYLRDTALTASNKVILEVSVSTPGTWSVNTDTKNGFKFSGSGSFSSTGLQTITLAGAGKPLAYGDTEFPLTAGTSQCSFSILVDTPHVAPCNPVNNTVNFSVAGVGPISLYGTTTTAGGGSYEIVGNGNGGDVTMEFAGTTQPKAGLYQIESVGGSFLPGSVRVSLVASSIYWQSNSGNLYVSIKNGKVVATFCNVSFSGSLGGPSYTTLASGTMTEE